MNSKFLLSLVISAVSVTLWGQTQSGYMPFHEYLLKNHGNIQKHNGNQRDVVFEKIAYSHYTFLNVADTWTPADSGVFNYNQNPNIVWETGANYYNFIQPTTWANSAQDTLAVAASGAIQSLTHQNFDTSGSTWVNSYMYSYTYTSTAPIGYLASETLQTWNGGAWVDSFQYNYTYDGTGRLTSLVLQIGSTLQNDSQYLYTYSGFNDSVLITQTWSGSAWVNALRQDNSFDASGNNTGSLVYTWSGGTWVIHAIISIGYDFNNQESSYTYQLWNGGINNPTNVYLEKYQNTLGNVTEFENYNWDSTTNSWTPVLLNTYDFDENHNCIFEEDQAYGVDSFNYTDLYYYYYESFTVSGIKNVQSNFTVGISPNPASANTVLSFATNNPGPIAINVYDAHSKIVKQLHINVSEGSYQIPLNLTGLAAGNYFVQVSDNTGKTEAVKFIKQ